MKRVAVFAVVSFVVGLGAACGGGSSTGGAGGYGAGESCGASQKLCGSVCVSTQSDNLNCGACNNVCHQGQSCSAGQCTATCAASEKVCQTDGGADAGADAGVSYCADFRVTTPTAARAASPVPRPSRASRANASCSPLPRGVPRVRRCAAHPTAAPMPVPGIAATPKRMSRTAAPAAPRAPPNRRVPQGSA